MGWHAEPEAGALYRLDPDGTVTKMLEGVTISNGLGWSPDGTTMYYVDTPTMRVDKFDFDPVSGDIANRREFVTIREGGGRPDGLTVDAEGAVWVATWPGYGVHRYLPDGTLDAIIPLPVSNVSSIELGGPDLRDAFITTAWELLSEEEHARSAAGGQPLPHAGRGAGPATGALRRLSGRLPPLSLEDADLDRSPASACRSPGGSRRVASWAMPLSTAPGSASAGCGSMRPRRSSTPVDAAFVRVDAHDGVAAPDVGPDRALDALELVEAIERRSPERDGDRPDGREVSRHPGT